MLKYNFIILVIKICIIIIGFVSPVSSQNFNKDSINNEWYTQSYSIPDSPGFEIFYNNTWLDYTWHELEIDTEGVIIDWNLTYTWYTDGDLYDSYFIIRSPLKTEKEYSTDKNGTYTVSPKEFNGEKPNGKWRLWIEDLDGEGGNQATNLTLTISTIPGFIITIPENTIEGKGRIQGQIEVTPPPQNEIIVNLTSTNDSAISVSSPITLSAEHHTKYFNLYVGDDNLLDGSSTYSIFAAAHGYYTGCDTIRIYDNEIATISVELPEKASITDDIIIGKLTVDQRVDNDIEILLTSDNDYFSVPSSVTIYANSASVPISISIIEDFDYTQHLNISASVSGWISISDTMNVLPILIPESERKALIDIYNSLGGINWNYYSNWLGDHGTECSWDGVECDNNHVTKISLSNILEDNIQGNIPESIGNFQYLSVLKLSGQITMLPENFENLENITELTLSYNKLTTLPEWFGNLKNLSILDLSKNQLTSLPESFCNLKQLSELNLDNNRFKTIPECIGELQNLIELKLDNNELTSIPDSFKNLINLSYLLLSSNQITYITNSIVTLKNLKHLDIKNNDLKSLPEGFGNLENLDTLYLSSNQLNMLPEDFGNLQNLTNIRIDNNKLSGLPDNFCNLHKLSYLSLNNNNLTCLPIDFGNLNNISYLDLNNNKLTDLPESIGNILNLSTLNLSNNNLSTLPYSFTEMIELFELDLSKNQLSNLPDKFGKIQKLYTLNLSNNQLQSIPESFGSLEKLESLNLSINKLSSLDDSFCNLMKISELDLSDNNLQSLPDRIGNLYTLINFDLSNNQLVKLPESIVALYKLHSLNLENNHIDLLPQNIGNLIQLKHLNLYKNRIKTIPDSIGNLINLQTIYLSDNSIASLAFTIGNLKNLQILDLSKNSLDYLPETAKNLTSLKRIDLSNNNILNFPYHLGMLPNLIEINMSYNNITKITDEIQYFKNLSTLNLSKNYIDEISKNIEKLTKLEYLDLSSCNLINETLPLEIFKLNNLRILSLEDNLLEYIPEEIDSLKNLTSLSLAYNAIGQITNKSLFNLVNLRTLDLSNNNGDFDLIQDELPLFGDIPNEILKLKNLMFINLTNTSLHTSSPVIEQFINERTFNWNNKQPILSENNDFTIAFITAQGNSIDYSLNSKIPISIVMTQPASLINGQLTVTLETGEIDREFVIQPFLSSYTATGIYTVQNGDFSDDLSITSITLSEGAVLKNSNGEYANLSSEYYNLNIMKNIYVDGTVPDVNISFPTEQCVDKLNKITGSAGDISRDFSIKLEIKDSQGKIKWNDEQNIYIHSNELPLTNWEFNPPQHIWTYDSSYTINVLVTDFAGNSNYDSKKITYGKKGSSIEANISRDNIIIGQQFNITGKIMPTDNFVGKKVNIIFNSPSGATKIIEENVRQDGSFDYAVKCNDIDRSGIWTIVIEWNGTNCLNSASSDEYTIFVQKATCEVALDATYHAIKLEDSVSITGKVIPQFFCNSNMIDIPVILRITNPLGKTYEKYDIKTSDIWGGFIYHAGSDFNMLGDWTIQASVRSDVYQPSFSETLNIKVVETSGYAIIIQGRISDGNGLEAHNKTSNNVYWYFKQRGLLDKDILYFNYDKDQLIYQITDKNLITLSEIVNDSSIIDDLKKAKNIKYFSESEFRQHLMSINEQIIEYEQLIFEHCSERIEIDGIPTKEAIKKAITKDIIKIMGNKPANLYIVMIDHGSENTFHIAPDEITDTDIAQWYESLEDTPGWNQEIITILGFCFSGSFIDSLSKRNRIIITSAASNEFSYKGPLDKDNIREGEYFISEFFKSASYGRTIKEAFIEAVVQTEIFTSKGQNSVNGPPYFDNSAQHPLLDDNGDGIGSNKLSGISGDGQLAKNISIGVSSLTVNNPGDVYIKDVSEPVFLGYTENTTNALWAEVNDNRRLLTLWIEVKSPGYRQIISETEQIEMILPKIVTNKYIEKTNRYQWNKDDLKDIFQETGTYQIFYFAKDTKTKNVSKMKQSLVYKASSINKKPEAFSLLSPKDGLEITSHGVIASCASDPTPKCYTMMTWEYAKDPDDDILSYTLLISKDKKDFDNPTIQPYSGLDHNFVSINIPEDWDGSTVYWKVQAIDKYGAIRDSNIHSFVINNTYNPVIGTITGYVYDSDTQMPIENAKVTVDNSLILTDIRGVYNEGFSLGASYKLIVRKEGYYSETRFPVIIPSEENFFLIPKKDSIVGDIDLNEIIDFYDIILGLKVLSGIEVDIESDHIISLKDILFIMNKYTIGESGN